MRRAAGQAGGAGGGGVGGELAAVDGGVDQDDVLGVDQPGGAGGGDRLPGQVGELPAGRRRLAVMTARTPPGRSTRWQAAYSSAGSVVAAGLRRGAAAGAVAAGDGQGGLPGVGVPGFEQQAGPPGRSRASGRAAGSRRARSPATRAPRPGGDQAEDTPARGCGGLDHRGRRRPGAATRSPGRENAVMTCAAAAAVTGPAHAPAAVAGGAGRAGPARCSPARRVPPRPGRRAAPASGWAARPARGRCEGVSWAAGPACRRFTPLTLQKSGFRGLFSRRPAKISGRGKSRGRRCRDPVKMSSGPPSCHLGCHLCSYLSSAVSGPGGSHCRCKRSCESQ